MRRLSAASRTVSFAGSAVRIEAEGPGAAAVLDFACRNLRDCPPASPHATLKIRCDAVGCWTLRANGREQPVGASAAEAARALLEAAAYELGARSTGGLLFHAAAVARDGYAFVFPGVSGAGKTSLATWLLSRGFSYLSDELVFVPAGTLAVRGFARPLSIRTVGRSVVAPFVQETDGVSVLASAVVTLAQPPPERCHAVDQTITVAEIVFPRYSTTGEPGLCALSGAQTCARLMGCLLNARNLPGHGFRAVAELARRVPACTLTYRSFGEIRLFEGPDLGPGVPTRAGTGAALSSFKP